jgi:hypothetical protein
MQQCGAFDSKLFQAKHEETLPHSTATLIRNRPRKGFDGVLGLIPAGLVFRQTLRFSSQITRTSARCSERIATLLYIYLVPVTSHLLWHLAHRTNGS